MNNPSVSQSVQSLSHVPLFATPWTATCQASLKCWLKLSVQNTKIIASGPITSWQIDGEKMRTETDFLLLGSKSLQMVTAAMKLKNACSLEEKLWPTSVQFSRLVRSDSLWPHELGRHARPPCPSPTPGVHPNPCPLSQWCHPTISSSVIPFSSCPQSFPASGSYK